MTSILAVVTKNSSLMVADTLGSDDTRKSAYQSKVIKKSNNMLMGVGGSYAIMNCMQYYFTLPKRRKDYTARQYMQSQVFFAIRNALVKMNLLGACDGEQSIKGEIIMIYEDQIYVIQNDFALLEVKDNAYSIGSGGEYTIAAYHTLDVHKPAMVAADKMREAIKITAKFCPSVNDETTLMHFRHDGQNINIIG